MKKWFYIFLTISFINMESSTKFGVQAVEVSEPYQLITQWEGESISQETCQLLIQEQYQQVDNTSELNRLITDYQSTLAELETAFNTLTNDIESLENNEDYSITQATQGLNQVIEATYQNLQSTDASFIDLTEAEQMTLVEADPTVIEWQDYLQAIIQQQNETIASRSMVETQYQETLYLLEAAQSQLAENQIADQQLNQCLLYAYSVPKINSDSFLADNQMSSLTEYLANLDIFLSQLVPYPYYQLRFEDIFQQFSQVLTLDQITKTLNFKGNIQLDETLKNQYQYQEELSLNEVIRFTSVAQNKVYQTQNNEEYALSYQEILLIKEAQFIYFSQINASAWQTIKENLANYLNTQGYISEEAIALVRQLHQKYQVKLVTFDDATQNWYPVAAMSTGFLEDYYYREMDWNVINQDKTTSESESEGEVTEVQETASEELPEDDSIVEDPNESESNLDSTTLPKPLTGSRYATNRSVNSNNTISSTKQSNNTLDNIKAKLATNQKIKSENNSKNNQTSPTNPSSKEQSNQKNSKQNTNKQSSKNKINENEVMKNNGQSQATTQSNKNQTIKLPTTGEQKRAMTWALVILLLGAGLLLTSTIYKRKQRQKLEEIDLDA